MSFILRNATKVLRDHLQIMVKLTIWLVKDYITKNLIGGHQKLSKSKPLESQDGRQAVEGRNNFLYSKHFGRLNGWSGQDLETVPYSNESVSYFQVTYQVVVSPLTLMKEGKEDMERSFMNLVMSLK